MFSAKRQPKTTRKRLPDCSWAFCFAFLVLSACGDSPEQIGAKRALTAFLPEGWQSDAVEIVARESVGDEINPAFKFRFEAEVSAAEDLFHSRARLLDKVILTPSVAKGRRITLHGVMFSKVSADVHRSRILALEGDPLDCESIADAAPDADDIAELLTRLTGKRQGQGPDMFACAGAPNAGDAGVAYDSGAYHDLLAKAERRRDELTAEAKRSLENHRSLAADLQNKEREVEALRAQGAAEVARLEQEQAQALQEALAEQRRHDEKTDADIRAVEAEYDAAIEKPREKYHAAEEQAREESDAVVVQLNPEIMRLRDALGAVGQIRVSTGSIYTESAEAQEKLTKVKKLRRELDAKHAQVRTAKEEASQRYDARVARAKEAYEAEKHRLAQYHDQKIAAIKAAAPRVISCSASRCRSEAISAKYDALREKALGGEEAGRLAEEIDGILAAMAAEEEKAKAAAAAVRELDSQIERARNCCG